MCNLGTQPGVAAQAGGEQPWKRRFRESGLESLKGFRVLAEDGDAGSVEQVLYWSDMTMPDYLVVGSGKWFFGHKSVLSVAVIEDVDPCARQLRVRLSREQVRSAPEFLPPP